MKIPYAQAWYRDYMNVMSVDDPRTYNITPAIVIGHRIKPSVKSFRMLDA